MPSQVRVIVRTKPTDNPSTAFRALSDNVVSITRPVAPRPGVASGDQPVAKEETLSFPVAAVLNNASQEAVYTTAASPMVESFLQGYNCTLMCFGQSGSGKTHTLFGGDAYPLRGCVPRALEVLFDVIRTSTERRYTVKITFVEVYGEQLFDLLGKNKSASAFSTNPKNANASRKNAHGNTPNDCGNKATVTIDGSGNAVLRGVEERLCATEAEALGTVFEGLQRRLSSPSYLNPNSSRSHAVLTLYLVSTSLLDSDALTHHSRFNFVDFAGSERATVDDGKQDVQMINRSIVMLEQVVLAMASSHPRHVPYRQSKLTMLLKNSLSGECFITLIATLWPQHEYLDATLSTLNFAKRMMRVESKPTQNTSMDTEAQVRMLQKQVNSLKSELRMQDQLAGRVAVPTAPLESDEISTARDIVMAYVKGTIPQIRVACVREMYACFSVFRSLVLERDAQLRNVEPVPSSRPCSSGVTKAQVRGKTVSKPSFSQEMKELTRFVNSVADTTTGIGMGSTDKLNPSLGDVFQQAQQRNLGSQCSAATPNTPRQGGDHVVAGHEGAAGATGLVASSSAVTAGTEGSTGRTSALPLHGSNQEKEASKNIARFKPHPLFKGDARRNTSIAMEKGSPTPQAFDGNFLRRSEYITRDRRAAFEVYKQTTSGVCQMQVINEAQSNLMRKNEAILQLQRRVQELRADLGLDKGEQQGLPALHHHSPRAKVLGLANSEIDGAADGSGMEAEKSTSSRNVGMLTSEQIARMSQKEKMTYLRHMTNAITGAMTDRDVTMNQLNRLHEVFMNNFNFWHQSNIQSSLPQQGEQTEIPTLKLDCPVAEGLSPARGGGGAMCLEIDDQFEAAALHRQLKENPDGATFYAARRLASMKVPRRP
ncbi:Microtubule binding Kinesin motor domain [Trypanosoma vivax]|nr:Microtubule binding Kinesin motor domain [Trypanosoma vivax]